MGCFMAPPLLCHRLLPFLLFCVFFFFWFKFIGKQETVKTGLITVLRTVWSDRGLHGSLFLLIERFFRLKEPQKLTVQGFSGRTVRSGPGFKTLVWHGTQLCGTQVRCNVLLEFKTLEYHLRTIPNSHSTHIVNNSTYIATIVDLSPTIARLSSLLIFNF